MEILSSGSNFNRLINNLEDLKLNTIRENLAAYITQVAQGEKDFTQELFELTELEKKQKYEKVIRSCDRTAGFPFLKEVQDFDFGFQPDLGKGKILELSTARFIENNENIPFMGTPGMGKRICPFHLGQMRQYIITAHISSAARFGRTTEKS